MKRYGWLFSEIYSWPNLLRAATLASKGKRSRQNVAAFNFESERELLQIQRDLEQKTYRPGPYRTFLIFQPKKRLISAAPFRDRVVHHALCNVVEPIWERSFIFDSYACRKGKGTHAAVGRAQDFCRRYDYVLKADIEKYFPSIDHSILKKLLRRKIKDRDVIWLMERIIDASNPQEPVYELFAGDDLLTPLQRPRGLPIGNQTSQFFANVYLNPLDHFVKNRLRLAYVRYVDDLLVFSNDKRELAEARRQVADFLRQYRLRLHRRKSVIFPCAQGVGFLGFRIFSTHRRLSKANVKQFRRRLRRYQGRLERREMGIAELTQRIQSWIGHAAQANTYRLRERLFQEFQF